MTEETDLTITDRKIKGDIERGYNRHVPQKGVAEFLAGIDRILAVPGITAIRWRQYTPYFNDGEPCEFSVNEINYRELPLDVEYEEWAEDNEIEGRYSDYEDGFYDTWGIDRDKHAPAGLAEALKEFNVDEFEDVARANFGEHAIVTATVDGFDVEFYEHD